MDATLIAGAVNCHEDGDLLLHGHPLRFSKADREVHSGPPRLD